MSESSAVRIYSIIKSFCSSTGLGVLFGKTSSIL